MSSTARIILGISGTLLAAVLAIWIVPGAYNGGASRGILILAIAIAGIAGTGIWALRPPSVRL